MIEFVVGVVLVSIISALAGAIWRMSKNVGPMDLEQWARNHDVVFVPVSREFAAGLDQWSKVPVRIRFEDHGGHPLLRTLVCKNLKPKEPKAGPDPDVLDGWTE